MIIKMLEDGMVDGKLRVRGEVCNAYSVPENSVIIKEDKKTKERIKKIKEKGENGKTK